MILCISYKVRYDQKIIYISHFLDRIDLIGQTLHQLRCYRVITLPDSLHTELFQILLGRQSIRHIKFRHLLLAKYDLYITTVCNLLCICKSLLRIREKLIHFFFGFQIILSTCIAHTIFFMYLPVCLDTQKDIVCLPVLSKDIVRIIRYDHRDTQLFGQPHNTCIYRRLLCQPMILHLKEIIVFSKYLQMTECCLFRSFIVVLS